MRLDPAQVYVDDGASGSTLHLRPALVALLAAANSQPRPFDVVIAESSSRLARNTIILATLIDNLTAAGIGMIVVSEHSHSDDANS